MNRPMNRRRFLELSASVTSPVGPGDTLESFSPQVSEIAFAATVTHATSDVQSITDTFLNETGIMATDRLV